MDSTKFEKTFFSSQHTATFTHCVHVVKQFAFFASVLLFFMAGHAQSKGMASSFIEDFSDSTLRLFKWGSTGTKSPFKWHAGAHSLSEPSTKILALKIDPEDSAGAGRRPEIISNDFTHFGTYTARLKLPSVTGVQPNVGAVVGYFTYHVDSTLGLSEIDFEWLIADPTIIYIGTWTGPPGSLKRIGRTINLAKGIIYNTIYKEGYKGQPESLTGLQNQPEKMLPIKGYDASKQFYTYGYDWHADRIRRWMLDPTSKQKIVLWDYQGSQTGIPQGKTHYRMNFWHTNEWAVETVPNSIEKPLHPYELEVDWMKYEPYNK